MRTGVDACECTWRGGGVLYGHHKGVCTGSWLWEKNHLPHQGLEPESVLLLTFQLDTLPTELILNNQMTGIFYMLLGWSRYWKKSQHRNLSLEKKTLPSLLWGLQPRTFQSWVWHFNTELSLLLSQKINNNNNNDVSFYVPFFHWSAFQQIICTDKCCNSLEHIKQKWSGAPAFPQRFWLDCIKTCIVSILLHLPALCLLFSCKIIWFPYRNKLELHAKAGNPPKLWNFSN